MSIIKQIEERLSITRKRVVYFVCEDREIVRDVLPEISRYRERSAVTGEGGAFYDKLRRSGMLVDAYTHFALCEGRVSNAAEVMRAPGAFLPTYFVLNDFHIIEPAKAAHFLKLFLAETEELPDAVLFLVSPFARIPQGLEEEVELIDVGDIGEEEIEALLTRAARGQALSGAEANRLKALVPELKGLKKQRIRALLDDWRGEYGSFYGRDALSREKLERLETARREDIKRCKEETARRDDTLVFLDSSEGSVFGMEGYTTWLKSVRDSFARPEEALELWGERPPKGVLLSGLPGTGKTLAARSTAGILGVTLLQFRMENLFSKDFGSSESNFWRCIKSIESLAPCVLLIDEIEKVFGINEHTHEVRQTIFAGLLDWMQNKKRPVFVFATANRVDKVPPELLRDGRMDMRYYTFMPMDGEVRAILTGHMLDMAKLTKGKLFSARLEDDMRGGRIAEAFTEAIADYARANRLRLFYTGANIENLVRRTQAALRRKIQAGQCARPCSPEAYLDTLLENAKLAASRPYGETNRDTIARFWLAARENKYANAAASEEDAASALFTFEDFDETAPSFPLANPALTRKYDLWMREMLAADIIALQEEKNKSDALREKMAKDRG